MAILAVLRGDFRGVAPNDQPNFSDKKCSLIGLVCAQKFSTYFDPGNPPKIDFQNRVKFLKGVVQEGDFGRFEGQFSPCCAK